MMLQAGAQKRRKVAREIQLVGCRGVGHAPDRPQSVRVADADNVTPNSRVEEVQRLGPLPALSFEPAVAVRSSLQTVRCASVFDVDGDDLHVLPHDGPSVADESDLHALTPRHSDARSFEEHQRQTEPAY